MNTVTDMSHTETMPQSWRNFLGVLSNRVAFNLPVHKVENYYKSELKRRAVNLNMRMYLKCMEHLMDFPQGPLQIHCTKMKFRGDGIRPRINL